MTKPSPAKRRARLAVFCSGFGSNFEAILRAVQRGQIRADIAVMITDNPKAYAIERAKKRDVPVVVLPSRLFPDRGSHERMILNILKNQSVDLVVLAGYMRIFTPYFTRALSGKLMNIHPSYLPDFKGAHAIRDAWQAKAAQTGVTVHWVTAEVDAGPVILQEKVNISKNDSLASLEKKIHAVEHRLYPQAIQRVIDSIDK